ncbi:hypothetical protein GCM10009647_079190 [Streptomyces sanglieri]
MFSGSTPITPRCPMVRKDKATRFRRRRLPRAFLPTKHYGITAVRQPDGLWADEKDGYPLRAPGRWKWSLQTFRTGRIAVTMGGQQDNFLGPTCLKEPHMDTVA